MNCALLLRIRLSLTFHIISELTLFHEELVSPIRAKRRLFQHWANVMLDIIVGALFEEYSRSPYDFKWSRTEGCLAAASRKCTLIFKTLNEALI